MVAGTWLDLGFTSPSQGAAVVFDRASHTGILSMTYDGGHSWSPVTFRSA